MHDFCELCGRDGLTLAYAPVHSHRGVSIYVCCYCGLVQSLPRIDHEPRARRDNVRFGKSCRTAVALAALKRHAPSDHFRLIDVGSHRSDFLDALGQEFPAADAVAVEPDESVATSASGKAELYVARIESLKFEPGGFDVVHSCHTIEHLAHPLRVLKDHARILKSGGLLLIDAPNIAVTGAADIIEEWFIDQHLYHFSARTLTRMIAAAGFEILEAPAPDDIENLFIVARKTGAALAADPDPNEVDRAVELVSTYAATRSHNADALCAIAEDLAAMAPKGVAVWGAGRIFDTVVSYGGFDPKHLAVLIDTHLKARVVERYGVKLSGPEALAAAAPAIVVVMTRTAAAAIAAEAKRLVPGAEVIAFADLLSRARLRLAA